MSDTFAIRSTREDWIKPWYFTGSNAPGNRWRNEPFPFTLERASHELAELTLRREEAMKRIGRRPDKLVIVPIERDAAQVAWEPLPHQDAYAMIYPSGKVCVVGEDWKARLHKRVELVPAKWHEVAA